MAFASIISFLFVLLVQQAFCQSAQDVWTAPARPEGSTTVKNGETFTIRWNSNLKGAVKTNCTACDSRKLSLWAIHPDNKDYNSRVAASIDVTSSTTYKWYVNFSTAAQQTTKLWTLRFAPSDAKPPFAQSIWSPGFKLSASSSSSSSGSSGGKKKKKKGGKLGKGAMIGIVVGVVVIVVVAVVAFIIWKRKQKKTEESGEKGDYTAVPTTTGAPTANGAQGNTS